MSMIARNDSEMNVKFALPLASENRFLNESQITITDLMHELITTLKTHAAKHRMTIVYEPTNIQASLKLDVDKIQQSIAHVVQNAIEFSNHSTTVYVMTGFDFNGDFYVRIDDEGAGIASEVLQRILEPFTRVENGVESSRANTGRGLSMVNAFLKMHFGYLRVQSQQNRGTSVTLTLPKSINVSR